jgi:hypothetical protein
MDTQHNAWPPKPGIYFVFGGRTWAFSELADGLEDYLETVPDHLAEAWLDRTVDAGLLTETQRAEDKTYWTLRFWDAVRLVMQNLIDHQKRCANWAQNP